MDIKDYGEVPDDFRKLRPHLNEEELREQHNQLMAYIELIVQMVDRIEEDPEEYAKMRRLIEEERSKRHPHI